MQLWIWESLCNGKLQSRWVSRFIKWYLGKSFFFISKLYGHHVIALILFTSYSKNKVTTCLESFTWKSNKPWENDFVWPLYLPIPTLLSVLFSFDQWYKDWLSSVMLHFLRKYRQAKHFLRKSMTRFSFIKLLLEILFWVLKGKITHICKIKLHGNNLVMLCSIY